MGSARIGGVVHGWNRSIVLAYAGPIGITIANMVQFSAVLKGLLIIKAMNLGYDILVEGDSQNVIRWCNKDQRVPWLLHSIWVQVVKLEGELSLSFHHVYGESNSLADGLAKRRVAMELFSILNDVMSE
ncbi:uncharacterized protein LOC110006680 [Amborella trichopoda]|uniref:uncharacterized protein LOC110006680 n=1 Tax=Amborella trichopoda TaxID=13333 RepID=UPI0009BD56C2|nr:uncharacterized protein LOC110006680 [Amborella trichopoda]|eukprot:XP_020518747.1 uncharacterized protein LOC110006680 [Amborella trichopoda]